MNLKMTAFLVVILAFCTNKKRNRMSYDLKLADRIRAYLTDVPGLEIEERKCSGASLLWSTEKCVFA
jgi:hypothetical protein